VELPVFGSGARDSRQVPVFSGFGRLRSGDMDELRLHQKWAFFAQIT